METMSGNKKFKVKRLRLATSTIIQISFNKITLKKRLTR